MEQITDQDIVDISLLPKQELTIFLTRLRHQINEINKLLITTAAAKRLTDQLYNTFESNDPDVIAERLNRQEQLKQLEQDLDLMDNKSLSLKVEY